MAAPRQQTLAQQQHAKAYTEDPRHYKSHCLYEIYVHDIDMFNPFTADPIKAVHFAVLVWPTIFIFDIWALWRLGLSARAPEYEKLKMVG